MPAAAATMPPPARLRPTSAFVGTRFAWRSHVARRYCLLLVGRKSAERRQNLGPRDTFGTLSYENAPVWRVCAVASACRACNAHAVRKERVFFSLAL